MAIPRHQLVDPKVPLCYHIVSRCVRRSWLCGFDRHASRNYEHRKTWLVSRLKQLASAFAVDVYAYAVMSNHFHLVVYYDPQAAYTWTDLEVAQRWLKVCPPKHPDGSVDESMRDLKQAALLADEELLAKLREKLGSLSVFMKLLKQPIARRANLEDGCTGHFFEQRFYSSALLSNEAVLSAMAYVDLNPVRAEIARSIAEAEYTSAHERLFERGESLQNQLEPVIAGLNSLPTFKVTLREYVDRLEVLIPASSPRWPQAKLRRWRDQVATLSRKQRMFGPEPLIKRWGEARGWQLREIPLPS